jgi:hypothetical protein
VTTFCGLTEQQEHCLAEYGRRLDSLADFIDLTSDLMWGETSAAAEIPGWVRKASTRLAKTYLAPVTTTLTEARLEPHRAGVALGLLEWVGKSVAAATPNARLKRAHKRRRIAPRLKRKLVRKWDNFVLRMVGVTKKSIRGSNFIPRPAEKYFDQLERKGSPCWPIGSWWSIWTASGKDSDRNGPTTCAER